MKTHEETHEFGKRFSIRPDAKANRTLITLELSFPGVFRRMHAFDWGNYTRSCRKSLHQMVAEESVDLQVWSIDLDWEKKSIKHSIYFRGVLPAPVSLRLARAVHPPSGYETLSQLARGLSLGWRIEPWLEHQVRVQQLCRTERNRKRLAEPIPIQLLGRAIMESNWQRLICPSDNPWGFINATTKRIYQRDYREQQEPGAEPFRDRFEPSEEVNSDQLVIKGIDIFSDPECEEDIKAVLVARAEGKKWRELPEYLTQQSSTEWTDRRVEAVRGTIRRHKNNLRSNLRAKTQFQPRRTGGTVYRERLTDGSLWNGLSTYSHVYQGSDLEVLHQVMSQERIKLFREK